MEIANSTANRNNNAKRKEKWPCHKTHAGRVAKENGVRIPLMKYAVNIHNRNII